MKSAMRLRRTTFQTDFPLEFFTQVGLTRQTGHGPDNWPLVVVKELIDNALDACEEAETSPLICVRVASDAIVVQDNGPGIPAGTVAGIIDFTTRVSSRAAYVAPTRGAQGNAFKTLLAIPYVLGQQRQGQVDIEAHGVCHRLCIEVDQLRGQPAIDHIQEPLVVKAGTVVKIYWPDRASQMLQAATGPLLQLASNYTFLNPHLHLDLDIFGERRVYPAVDTGWSKWRPDEPTCPHWYTVERLESLIAAYLAEERVSGRNRTVRQFLVEFRGLSGSAKASKVLKSADLLGASLSKLRQGNRLDRARIARLLEAMKEVTSGIAVRDLGILGKERLRRNFTELGCAPDSFRYARKFSANAAYPWSIEVAFAWLPDAKSQRLVTGVNWAASLVHPFRELNLDELLHSRWAGADEPVVVFAHLCCPRLEYTDHGKSTVALHDELVQHAQAAVVLEKVTSKWTKQRNAELRNASRIFRRAQSLGKPSRRVSIRDVAERVLADAYRKVSGPQNRPAHARQIYYAARPTILQELGLDSLDSQYFCQDILPRYLAKHAEETREWDVVFDARGNFAEPHTERIVPLGTIEVRNYLRDAAKHRVQEVELPDFETEFPTCGPANRFQAILFIEKEGFMPLFRSVHLAERFDLAIMSTKGVSVTASRKLVEALCGDEGVPLLVLHDFDKSGFSILGTLQRDTSRFQFANSVRVIDLGLRLEDVQEYELEDEPVDYGKPKNNKPVKDPRINLRENGATEDEVNFLVDDAGDCDEGFEGRRVELNAFTSDDLVEWIEGKLVEQRVAKVLPDMATLTTAYRRALEVKQLREHLEKIKSDVHGQAQNAPVPQDLVERMRAELELDPTQPWDKALQELVDDDIKPNSD